MALICFVLVFFPKSRIGKTSLCSHSIGKKIVTEITPLEKCYLAENYHQDYYATHPGNLYCEVVTNPNLEKIQQQFTALLKGILTLRGYESH